MSQPRVFFAGFVAVLVACGPPPAPAPPPTTAPAPEPEQQEPPQWPDEPFRAERPKPKPEPRLQIPALEDFRLANGLQVYLLSRRQLPVVSMQLVFPVGAAADPANKAGLASTCMDLMTEGTDKLDKVKFAEAQADLASSIWSSASREQATVGMRTLKRNLEPTLALYFGALKNPGMRDRDLQRLVKRRIASVKQSSANPAGAAGRVVRSVVFGKGHPASKIQTEATLAKLTRNDCTRLARRLKPDGARLFVVGDVDRAELEEALEPHVKDWRGKAPRARNWPKPRGKMGTVYFIDIPDAEQSSIYVAHPGPARTADDYAATMLVARILGGSFSSRINMNLREDKGWAYGARAGFSYYRTQSWFSARSKVKTDVTVDALEEILGEIEGMTNAPPESAELTREQQGALRRLPSRFATGRGALNAFGSLIFFGLPLDYYNEWPRVVSSLDAEALHKAAMAHLDTKEFVVVVAGDGAVIREELKELADSGRLGKGGLVEIDADANPVR